MTGLAEWLRAQIAEDRRLAEQCTERVWQYDAPSVVAGHPTNEVVDDAKDRLLDLYENAERIYKPAPQLRAAWGAYQSAVKAAALPYADRAGYLAEWRP